MLILDAYSNWPVIHIVKNMTAENSKDIFLKHGLLPHHIVADSGCQFTGAETKRFFLNLDTRQTFTAPNHPAKNEAVKNYIKTFKQKLKAIVKSTNLAVKATISRLLF